MITPKGVNIDKALTVSGVKDIGNYTYVLLIDFAGLALIKRIKSDNTEIKYYKIPSGEMDVDWASPETQDYVWIHQV